MPETIEERLTRMEEKLDRLIEKFEPLPSELRSLSYINCDKESVLDHDAGDDQFTGL